MQSKFLLQREVNQKLFFGNLRSSKFDPHFHSQIEIYLILSGELDVCINNERKKLRQGEISVSFSYDIHSYKASLDMKAYSLIIPTAFCGNFLPLLSSKNFNSSFIDDTKTYTTVKDSMERLIEGANDISTQGHIYVILGAILDSLKPNPNPEKYASPFSPELLIYISNHFREKLTISDLAANFGYNQNYLSQNFHNTFGVPFSKYITMLRLRETVSLLQKGDKSVTECAFECGFGSLRSFYRAFRDEFGCSPKEYINIEKSKLFRG